MTIQLQPRGAASPDYLGQRLVTDDALYHNDGHELRWEDGVILTWGRAFSAVALQGRTGGGTISLSPRT